VSINAGATIKEGEMNRAAILAIALPLLFAGVASGQALVDDMGLGVAIGVMQPGGGDQSYEDMGLTFGLRMSKPLTESVSVMLDYHHGETESGELPSTAEPERFFTWGATDYFKTNWNYLGLKAVYDFTPGADFVPYVSLGFGMTMWEVQDWRSEASSPGVVPDGYDADGKKSTLSGTNLTATIGAGVEFFLNERMSLDIGGSYGFLLQQDVDNVGFSAALGADYVDANSSVFDGSVALMFHFGAGDCDEDGIFGSQDKCPRAKEDYDGFEDEDGCPDVDNDMDGIMDVDDACPDDAEDFDGDMDEDGCPDVDRDGDGIMDQDDACPDNPEDIDGFQDEDGCPDPDNDGDGVLDTHDKCPGTPPGTVVDAVGCPKPEPKPELLAVMVNFRLNSAVLSDEMKSRLGSLVTLLLEDETITVNIGGYASDEGTDEYNMALSERRAGAVRDYLVQRGVDAARISIVGYGEQQPLVPNTNETNRSQNRRAMVTPTYSE
jgi:outer membrane protein OmpA-like peptidoglycan-associated protein/opacity protein-like surface antigen